MLVKFARYGGKCTVAIFFVTVSWAGEGRRGGEEEQRTGQRGSRTGDWDKSVSELQKGEKADKLKLYENKRGENRVGRQQR